MTHPFVDLIDLASERLGGAVVAANDEFFAPKEHLIRPTAPVWREGEYTDRGKWMDGWETRRRRGLGHDWCLVKLGVPIGITSGIVGGVFYNRFSGIKLPEYLAFFGGRRFVPIVAGLAGLAIAALVALGEPADGSSISVGLRTLASRRTPVNRGDVN